MAEPMAVSLHTTLGDLKLEVYCEQVQLPALRWRPLYTTSCPVHMQTPHLLV